MYVDKKLGGVQAVQTLSRLNRTYPGKDKTFVLDFVNEPLDVLDAFRDYYRKAELTALTTRTSSTTSSRSLMRRGSTR